MGNQNTNNNIKEYENDMEEWEGNLFSGVGIKRMKAYKCKLNANELEKKRNKFWEIKLKNRKENFINWSIIQRAITLDEPRDIHYLQYFNIEPIDNCIKECRDKEGIIYKIPNYCINDPYFERQLNDKNINQIEEKLLEIKIYRYGDFEPFTLKVKNTLSGEDLKEKCREHEKLNNNEKIMVVVYGIEIKSQEYLYQHNLTEDKPIFLIVK